jgi:hypothetical protein
MDPNESQQTRPGISRSTWVLIGFLAVAAYFLFSEHRAHFISYLPFLLLAACPLMHLFHGHGGHGGHSAPRDDLSSDRPPPGSQRDQPAAGTHHRH